MSEVRELSEKYMVSIILHIREHPGCLKTELYMATSNNPNIPRRLDKLESMGLLTQTRTRFNGPTTLDLTIKGEKVADGLKAIDLMMRESL